MANTYVTDLRHYLDDSDDLADMPGPALNLAMVLTSVVRGRRIMSPRISCPRTCGVGVVRVASVAAANWPRAFGPGSPEIAWHCPMCGVNGVIRGWEHSLRDLRRGPA
jgi:hypothetical protein